jgi:hypothetical protein
MDKELLSPGGRLLAYYREGEIEFTAPVGFFGFGNLLVGSL